VNEFPDINLAHRRSFWRVKLDTNDRAKRHCANLYLALELGGLSINPVRISSADRNLADFKHHLLEFLASASGWYLERLQTTIRHATKRSSTAPIA